MKKIHTRKKFRYARIEKAWIKAKNEMEQTIEWQTHRHEKKENRESRKYDFHYLLPTYQTLIQSDGYKKFHAIDKIRRALKKSKKAGNTAALKLRDYSEPLSNSRAKNHLLKQSAFPWKDVYDQYKKKEVPKVSTMEEDQDLDAVFHTIYEFFRKLIGFFRKK